MREGRTWNRDELVLALELYLDENCVCDSGDIQVRELAAMIERSPVAVVYKMLNFEALDPDGQGGLDHYGQRDNEVWNEFCRDRAGLHMAADTAVENVMSQNPSAKGSVSQVIKLSIRDGDFFVPDSIGRRRTRNRQDVFRDMVLTSYGHQCALCDIGIEELLVAAHIVPWAVDPMNRLNPRNGISLCALHDRVFDRGPMTILDDGTIELSPRLAEEPPGILERLLGTGQLRLPHESPPDEKFLQYHREHIFQA